MPTVIQPFHARGKRAKRRHELRALKVRAELQLAPPKEKTRRFPYGSLSRDLDSDDGKARGRDLDRRVRERLGIV